MIRKVDLIFISYSRMDKDIVKPLVKLLRAAGQEVFVDKQNIPYGSKWQENIKEAIRKADRFLIFWSNSSSESEYVKDEIKLALVAPGCTIVPIMLDKTPLPENISQFQGIGDLESLFDSLIKAKKYKKYVQILCFGLAVVLGAFFPLITVFGPMEDRLLSSMNFAYWFLLLSIIPFIYTKRIIKPKCELIVEQLTA